METIVRKTGDVAVVTLISDQLDVGNADSFRQEIAPVLDDVNKLVLDLSRVQFVDSRGCGAMIACLKQVSATGGVLKLCGVTPPVRTVLELIRLHRICEFLNTPEEAVQAFHSPSDGG